MIPFLGLLFPGSHELDQNNISVILEKVEAGNKK